MKLESGREEEDEEMKKVKERKGGEDVDGFIWEEVGGRKWWEGGREQRLE